MSYCTIYEYYITRCSAVEDVRKVKDGFFTEIIELESVKCNEIRQKLTYTFPVVGIITNLIPITTTLTSNTVTEELDKGGNYKGITFEPENEGWKNLVVQVKYKIHLSDRIAMVNSKENKLKLSFGTILKLAKSYG